MPRTEFIATGFHVPERVVTNDDLAKIMDTSDEWITQRSGIKTRHWVSDGETGAGLARRAALQALAKAGMKPADLDCIVYCTCTPDHFEPGNGVFLQRELGITDIPAIDVRNQCAGFVYGLSVADAWISQTLSEHMELLLLAPATPKSCDAPTRQPWSLGLLNLSWVTRMGWIELQLGVTVTMMSFVVLPLTPAQVVLAMPLQGAGTALVGVNVN